MEPSTKKKFSYVVIGVFFFLGGVEYAVILPTAWFYLQQRFNAPSYMLGVLISAFCFSSLLAGPLMGRWSDKVGRTKAIFLFANLFEIVGNIMYFLGLDAWFLIAGRFVAGVGAGVGAPIIADITRITTSKERTGVISLFMAVRQIGLIVGPGFNLFLRKMDFSIGTFPVDKYSAPGAFMAILWIILELMVLALYWDLPTLQGAILRQTMAYSYRTNSESQFQPPTPAPSIIPPDTPHTATNGGPADPYTSTESSYQQGVGGSGQAPAPKPRRYPSLDVAITSSSEMIESAERFMVAGSADSGGPIMFSATPPIDDTSPLAARGSIDDVHIADGTGGYGTMNGHLHRPQMRDDDPYLQQQPTPSDTASVNSEPKPAPTSTQTLSWAFYYDEFIREEVIAILAVVFIAFFNQTCMEAMITPLAQMLLNWDELEVSLLYCGAGVEIILVFFLITFLSRHLHDRTLLLMGYVVVLATIGGLLGYLPNAPHNNSSFNLPFILSGVILDIFGLPFLVVTSTSLFSKVTREETQGFAQGVRGACGGIGTLLGPLWADSLISHLYLMLGVMLGLMFIALGMLLLSFKHMKEKGVLGSVESSHSVNAESPRHQGVNDSERQPLLGSRQ